MDLLEWMLEHDQWTTTLLLDRCTTLTDLQLDQAFNIGHGTLRETLEHMMFELGFSTAWMAGRPVADDRTTQPRDRSIAGLAERHTRDQHAFASLACKIQAEGRMDDTFVDHAGTRQSLGATILQVILHNTEHLSEARHMVHRLGAALWDDTLQEWEMASDTQ